MLAGEQSSAIDFASAERRGVEYQGPAWEVTKLLDEHRTLGALVAAGNTRSQTLMEDKQRQIDSALSRLSEVDARLGEEMKTTQLLQALLSDWNAIKSRAGGGDVQAYLSAHNKLVYDIGRISIKMGNHSNLILDPDIDTYYLMDATLFKLTRLIDQLSQIQAIGAASLSRESIDGEYVTPFERAQIATASTRAEEYLREGVTNLEYAFEYKPGLRSAMGGSVQVVQSSVAEMLSDANSRLGQTGGVDGWLASTDKAIDSAESLYEVALANLDQGLAERIGAASTRRTGTLASMLVLALVALGLTLAVVRSIVGPISALRDASNKVSLGDLTAKVDAGGSDEVSELARSFARMQESLKIAAREAGEI
ncbi:MAG: HAMP domain-containing protein [Myxococcota bacterium]